MKSSGEHARVFLSATPRDLQGHMGSGVSFGPGEIRDKIVYMLTFTWLFKPAHLASGDLHLASERSELGFGRITAGKPGKSYFIAFISPNCLSL